MILKVTAFWLIVLAALFDCRLRINKKDTSPAKGEVSYILLSMS